MAWKPAPLPGVDVSKLPLSPLQGFVVSRLDGRSDVEALSQATGLPAERLGTLLTELVTLGVVTPDPSAPLPVAPVPSAPAPPPVPAAFAPPPGADFDEEAVTDPNVRAVSAAELEAVPDVADAEAPPGSELEDDAAEEPEAVTATHRELFETRLRAGDVDERAAAAKKAVEPELSAWCFDPVPQVVKALLENPNAGPVQARLIARHHRNPAGLEAVAARAAFAADAGVRRALLHNPILPASLYRRLWGARRLLDQFKVTVSREVPDQTKRTAREALRQRFATGPAEERVELILKTEGRCLVQLTGLPIDSKTTALLCGRTFASSFLVQNVARWSAAPPALIAHLLRQETVRRNPTLRTLLQRHPNAPSGGG